MSHLPHRLCPVTFPTRASPLSPALCWVTQAPVSGGSLAVLGNPLVQPRAAGAGGRLVGQFAALLVWGAVGAPARGSEVGQALRSAAAVQDQCAAASRGLLTGDTAVISVK